MLKEASSTLKEYNAFLESKRLIVSSVGIDIALDAINSMLFPFQAQLVQWALRKGRCALFADCGLGKSFMQLEWARLTGERVLIVAPLAVAQQTVREAAKLGIEVQYARSQQEATGDIVITNYEMIDAFTADAFGAVVLDESSRLKSYMGVTKRKLIQQFRDTRFKLCCTATPAPNDILELGNHAEFLGIMPSNEMISRWFINNTMEAGDYRLKNHAAADFWRWVASWAMSISRPSDMGFSDDGFILPEMRVHEHTVGVDIPPPPGMLISVGKPNATTMHHIKRTTAEARAKLAAELISDTLHLIGNSDKLAACGNQNTPNAAKKNTTQTPKSGSEDAHRAEHQKRTANTCVNTTGPIKSVSKSIKKLPPKSETIDGVSVTPQTKPTAPPFCNRLPNTDESTPIESERHDSAPNSESPSKIMTACSLSKAGPAPSVGEPLTSETRRDCTLTTATKQAQSGASCVHPATSESGISEITPSCSDAQPITSQGPASPEPWLVWCDTDYEQRALEGVFGNQAISVYGSLSSREKESRILSWLRGDLPILISKPSICGWGLNFQHCHNVIFVGLNYSFEKYYQAVRRTWRYGQQHPVDVHIIQSSEEAAISESVWNKARQHREMYKSMVDAVKDFQKEELFGARELQPAPEPVKHEGKGWELWHGDCVEVTSALPADSIDFTVFSPPFSNLYIYSDSVADMGNCADDGEFFRQFGYLVEQLHRVTVPGRLCAVHCKDLPLYKGRDGAAGLRDFPGETIKLFESKGWTFHSRVTIWKDPVIEMQRTKNHGLLHKILCQDSAASRQGMADYLIVFRKWTDEGVFPRPVHDPEGSRLPAKQAYRFVPGKDEYVGTEPPLGNRSNRDYSIAVWQRYASPVWLDINQMNVLNYQIGKDDKDEKHIAPLQLDVIERAIHLWTNPGDLVFSPFTGVGSEGYVAVKMGRRFTGTELKDSYVRTAVRHLTEAESLANQMRLL